MKKTLIFDTATDAIFFQIQLTMMTKQFTFLLIFCTLAVFSFAQNVEKPAKTTPPTNVVTKKVMKSNDTTNVVNGSKPLILVDGQKIKNINDINPNDIESVDVLKGESATKQYGQKGSEGVIVITTKKKSNLSKIVGVPNSKKLQITIDKNAKDETNGHHEVTKGHHEEEMNVLIEGDKIIINGKEVDKNDPRINGNGNRNVIIKKIKGEPKQFNEKKKGEMIIENDEDDYNFNMEVPPPNAAFLGVITETKELGASIMEVSEGSPAEKAGLQKGDIITRVNDIKVKGPDDLFETIGKFQPATKVQIHILRNGVSSTLNVELEKNKNLTSIFNFNTPNQGQMRKPNWNPSRPDFPKSPRINGNQSFGFELPQLREFNNLFPNLDKPKLGISIEDLEEGDGVRITSVNGDSPAAKAGLKENDIIIQLNDKIIKNVDGIKPMIRSVGMGMMFKFNILRNGKATVIELKVPKKINTADL